MNFLCDFDGKIPRDVITTRLHMVARVLNLRVQWIRFDRTRHGYHMIVHVSNRLGSPVKIVLVQALLGSDWKREAFNARRVWRSRLLPKFWRTRWNVLYHTHHREIAI